MLLVVMPCVCQAAGVVYRTCVGNVCPDLYAVCSSSWVMRHARALCKACVLCWRKPAVVYVAALWPEHPLL